MNVLVTGAAGYIGSEVVRLLAQDTRVEKLVLYDNLSRHDRSIFTGPMMDGSRIKLVIGDLLDSRRLRRALEGIDTVIHLAARVSTPFANVDAHAFEQINHWGTAELVYSMEECGVRRLVHASSASVYGLRAEPISGTADTRPDSYYGVSKLRAEQHVTRFGEKNDAIILRLGNVYGPGIATRFDAVINRFLFDAHFNGRITINGSGRQRRPFLQVRNAAVAFAHAIHAPLASGIHDLVDHDLSILEVLEVLIELYPDLEFFFVDQHVELLSAIVQVDHKLHEVLGIQALGLKEELAAFKATFAFRPGLRSGQ